MKVLKLFCLIAVIINFFVQIFFIEQRTPGKQFFSMAFVGLFFLLMLIAFIVGLSSYRHEKFRAFIPFLICFIGLPVSFICSAALANSINESRFQKNLPRFNEVVNLIQKGELKPNPPNRFVSLPPQYADLTLEAVAFASTNSDGTNIEFQTENGFPVKHSGYLYVSSGKISNSYTLEDWPICHRINTNWFRVSD